MGEDGKKGRYYKWSGLFYLFSFTLALGCVIFGILCIKGIHNVWVNAHLLLCASVYTAFIIILWLFSLMFAHKRKDVPSKALFGVLLLLFVALCIWLALQKTGFFDVFEDAQSLQEYLRDLGVWTPIFYIILQFLQVVILPIPSIITTVAGVAIFGAFWSMLYSFIGIMLGSLLAFYIGRRWGKRAVAWLIGADVLQKWQQKLRGKDNIFLTVMFLLPLFPDDILCFLAGLSSMSSRYFIIMISISRLLAISGTCYSVDFIPFNTWWGIMLWGIIIIGVAGLCIIGYKNMDKIQLSIKKIKKK